MKSSIFYVALSLSLMGPASADVRIISSSGGVVDPYLTFFSQLRRSGQRVIIDGPCLSACTLVLNTIPRNRSASHKGRFLAFMPPYWLIALVGSSVLVRQREQLLRPIRLEYGNGLSGKGA